MIFNTEAEKTVIGCMVIDNETAERVTELTEEHFYIPEHKQFYNVILKCVTNGEMVDLVTLSKYITGSDFLKLAEIASSTITSTVFEHYRKILDEYYKRRKLIEVTSNIITKSKDTFEDIDELVNYSEQEILKINDLSQNNKTSIIEDVVSGINLIEERYRLKGKLPGIESGLLDWDNKTLGLQKKHLVILAARPSMGKTACALRIIEHVALKLKKPVLFFSLEMSKEDIYQRLWSQLSKIKLYNIQTGLLKDDEWEKLANVTTLYSNSSLKIEDKPYIHFTEVLATARRFKKQYGEIGLIVLDHLTEMKWKGENIRIGVGENVRGCKRIAKELDCPFLLLSQLSRATEQRQDKTPMLSDLRETGEIEQVADIVSFLHRESYYNPTDENLDRAELITSKNRNGKVGKIYLKWFGDIVRFDNLYNGG